MREGFSRLRLFPHSNAERGTRAIRGCKCLSNKRPQSLKGTNFAPRQPEAATHRQMVESWVLGDRGTTLGQAIICKGERACLSGAHPTELRHGIRRSMLI